MVLVLVVTLPDVVELDSSEEVSELKDVEITLDGSDVVDD